MFKSSKGKQIDFEITTSVAGSSYDRFSSGNESNQSTIDFTRIDQSK